MAKDFILVTDTSNQEQLISVSHIARIYRTRWWNSVNKEYCPRYIIEVAGAVDGLAVGARVEIMKEKYEELIAKLYESTDR